MHRAELFTKLKHLTQQWIKSGLPSRETLLKTAEELTLWKRQHGLEGIWKLPPRLFTATLDDGIGQGIRMIELYAGIVGMQVYPLGWVQQPETIVAACKQQMPDYLGLTVLQPDSEEGLCYIGHRLPTATRLIAGGPAFKYDPELGQRCAVHYTAVNVAFFMEFLLQMDWADERPAK